MRRIRFGKEMIEAIKQGKKWLTFRTTPRPIGEYIVEEGGHPYGVHIDSGIRIKIIDIARVDNIYEYAKYAYEGEGFKTPGEFISYGKGLYKGRLPTSGYGHAFILIS